MCMYDGDTGDYDFASDPVVARARKTYRCDECWREITAGERYERITFFGDLGTMTYLTCEHCLTARSWLAVVCRGWLYEAVREDLEEHWRDSTAYRSLHLGRLIVGMRRKWSRRDGSLMPLPTRTTREMVPVAA